MIELKKMHSIIFKNTFYQTLARTATSFIGFFITIIIARNFGVLGFGDFIKVTSFVAIFYLMIDFGLNAFFLQYEKANFKNLFYLRVFISAFLFIILNVVAFLIPYNQPLGSGFSESVKIGILIFSFSLFSQAIILSSAAIFQKSVNYFNYMLGLVVGATINLILVFIFTFLNYSIFFIYSSFAASSFISAVILLKASKEPLFPAYFDFSFAKKIFISSIPLGLMLIFNMVYFRADIILLSILSSTESVGVYGLSYKFFDFLIALPLFLSNAVYPFLIKYKDDQQTFLSFCRRYFIIFLLSSIVIVFLFWFASPLFSLIKQDFSDSIFPFRVLLLSLPFFFTTSFLQWILITLKKQRYLLYVYAFSGILNIVLNIIFIPKFSYFASAFITLFSEGIVFVFLSLKIMSIFKNKGETNV